jgi:predicted PhzF superfamily epimerase YddE/YHI9
MMVGDVEARIVDVFVGPDALGNPAGVVVDDVGLEDARMAAIAAEVGLSETAFVRPSPLGASIRWFTPTCEVDICGHATMAAVAVLAAAHEPASETVIFTSRAGPLRARCAGQRASVDLPRRASTQTDLPAWARDLGALDALAATGAILIELGDPAWVRALEPSMAEIAAEPFDLVVVWALGGVGAEVTLRVFGPRIGLAEDPVTGSAQCSLGPAIAGRIGASSFRAHQGSARGGRVEVTVREHSVEISGSTRIRIDEVEG